jgi:transposase
MVVHDAIGLDPDSCACVATLVRRNGTKPVVMRFPLTLRGRKDLAQFIGKVPGCLVGIEGHRGQSSPLEEFFDEVEIAYYSVPALNVDSYRKAMVGANKNNHNDAEAVAKYLLDLEARGELARVAKPERVDFELRLLARQRLGQSQQITVLVNQLWKLLKICGSDLYLALKGSGDVPTAKTKLSSVRLLRLFSKMPQLGSWKNLSADQILELSGGKKVEGWENFALMVQTASSNLTPIGTGAQLVIHQTADTILTLLEQEKQLNRALTQEVGQRPQIKTLMDHYKGMGAFTAALMFEEIVTIDRFPNDDHLASYAGLTKRDHSTGTNTHQLQPYSCNSRLKLAFISFAKEYLLWNKDSHLEKYHSNLLKKGMSRMESMKRIARALARDVYRFLKTTTQTEQQKEEAVALGTDSQLSPWSTSNTALPSSNLVPLMETVNTGGSP